MPPRTVDLAGDEVSVHSESSCRGDERQPGQSDRGSEHKTRRDVAAAEAGESHGAQAQAGPPEEIDAQSGDRE